MFVVRDGKVEFVPIKMGIAGDKYFEVLSRPQGGRRSRHRPVQLRPQLQEGAAVKIDTTAQNRQTDSALALG